MEDGFEAARAWMVRSQIEARGVACPELLAALRAVPRHRFLPRDLWEHAHADHPLPLAPGSTLSQPFIVALMLEALGPMGGRRVLEVGSGCGYVLALLDHLGAEAFGIELDEALAERSRETLQTLGLRAQVRSGDGARGWPEEAPFDGLMLSCATGTLPRALRAQLRPGAPAVYPKGSWLGGQMLVLEREGEARDLCPVAFVGMR